MRQAQAYSFGLFAVATGISGGLDGARVLRRGADLATSVVAGAVLATGFSSGFAGGVTDVFATCALLFDAALAGSALGFAAGLGAAVFAVALAVDLGAGFTTSKPRAVFVASATTAGFGATDLRFVAALRTGFFGAGFALVVGAWASLLLVKSGVGALIAVPESALNGAIIALFITVPMRNCCSMVLPTICQPTTVALTGSINKFIPIFLLSAAAKPVIHFEFGLRRTDHEVCVRARLI